MTEDLPLTEQEIVAIEARARAATEGPWAARFDGQRQGIFVAQRVVVIFDVGHLRPSVPDADFIVNARTDVPRLLAELRRLQAENARLLAKLG